jgi:hypothetical protein
MSNNSQKSYGCSNCIGGCKTTYNPVIFNPEQDAIVYFQNGFRLDRLSKNTPLHQKHIQQICDEIGQILKTHPSHIQYRGMLEMPSSKDYVQQAFMGFRYDGLLLGQLFADIQGKPVIALPRLAFLRTSQTELTDLVELCIKQ